MLQKETPVHIIVLFREQVIRATSYTAEPTIAADTVQSRKEEKGSERNEKEGKGRERKENGEEKEGSRQAKRLTKER